MPDATSGPTVQDWLRDQEVLRWREAYARTTEYPIHPTRSLTREEMNAWADSVLYREAGMEPPWLLEWEDGKVVGSAQPKEPPAPRHEV